jgi:acyl-CoA dehydrogenase
VPAASTSGYGGWSRADAGPEAGSNSLAIKTFARREGDGWRLNGQKG